MPDRHATWALACSKFDRAAALIKSRTELISTAQNGPILSTCHSLQKTSNGMSRAFFNIAGITTREGVVREGTRQADGIHYTCPATSLKTPSSLARESSRSPGSPWKKSLSRSMKPEPCGRKHKSSSWMALSPTCRNAAGKGSIPGYVWCEPGLFHIHGTYELSAPIMLPFATPLCKRHLELTGSTSRVKPIHSDITNGEVQSRIKVSNRHHW